MHELALFATIEKCLKKKPQSEAVHLESLHLLNVAGEVRAEELANSLINLFQVRFVVQCRFRSYSYQAAVWQKLGETARALERMNWIPLRCEDQRWATYN
jgi:hypothetical protein